ncbi:MAG: DnaA/Hda family protein [Alphaproteobacteria bacterium]|nr:DnaA/Hda family protein [Alphaproteobacteria bacterium]
MSARQLTLDLPVRSAKGREDFLVAPCNEAAVKWIDAWPEWPGRVLVLVGPAGSGKSHLGNVWRTLAGAAEMEEVSDERTAAALEAGIPVLLDINSRVEDEEALLHLINWARERKAGLLITATEPPAKWRITLPDLRSRLQAAPIAALGPPDDDILGALLIKQFADRQLRVPTDVVEFVLARMERSYATVRRLVEELDRAALSEKRAITVPLARQVLQKL